MIEMDDILSIANVPSGYCIVVFVKGYMVCSCPDHDLNRKCNW